MSHRPDCGRPALDTNVTTVHDTDVLVIGGGPAGTWAALAARVRPKAAP